MDRATCQHCRHTDLLSLQFVPLHDRFDYECSKCGKANATGVEQQLRPQMEQRVPHAMPRVTSLRAAAVSYKIYEEANKAGPPNLKMSKTTTKALKKDASAHQIVAQVPIYGRTWRGLTDSSLVAMVIVFANPGELPPYSIYVVFRGSVGGKNDGNAGWMSGAQKINIDWRANFDNVQERADYGGASCLIHGGYKSSLGSYRDNVFQALALARRTYHGSNVVITGHSQGAGHAVLFTHWLSYQAPDMVPNLFCMPFSPPRVGDFNFASDFNQRIVVNETILPFDGPPPLGAMLVVKGNDPVSFSMEHSYTWKDDPQAHAVSLRKYADSGLIKGGLMSEKKEKKYGTLQVYFHPSCLKILPGATLAKGKAQVLNHKPNWIRNDVRDAFNS